MKKALIISAIVAAVLCVVAVDAASAGCDDGIYVLAPDGETDSDIVVEPPEFFYIIPGDEAPEPVFSYNPETKTIEINSSEITVIYKSDR